MAKKRVRITMKEKSPAVEKNGGYLFLEKGDFANVRFNKEKQRLELRIKQGGGKVARNFYPVEEYEAANDSARRANEQGKQAGAGFGALRKEEEAALKRWRAYVMKCELAGTPARNLDDALRELIEREEHKDETPFFKDIVFDFLEEKERRGVAKIQHREIVKGKLKRLSALLGETHLSDFSPAMLEAAIFKIAKPRGGGALPPKSLKEWLAVAKEIFNWWYVRENDKRARERLPNLHNPLALLKFPKIRKEGTPEIISVSEARALLAEIYASAPEILPVVSVQLFCGVRRDEALRLQWKDFRENEIFIPASKAKTDGERSVPVSENLRAWLDAFRVLGNEAKPDSVLFPFAELPKDFNERVQSERELILHKSEEQRAKAYERRLRRALKTCGIEWKHNFCRHTAVSFLCKRFGFSNAADWCGHSIRTQGKFYRAAVSEQDAKDYFGIMPPNEGKPAIVFSREQAKAKREHDEGGASVSGESRAADAAGSAGTVESEERAAPKVNAAP